MPDTIARIASIALAVAFGWAGLTKLVSFKRWSEVLNRYGLPKPVRPVVSMVTPLVEFAISAMLILGVTRAGAITALIALALFSLAILRARSINGDRLPCGCFGGANKRDYKTMLLRNAALGVLASMALLTDGDLGTAWPSAPVTEQMLPAALTVVGTIFILWIAWQASVSLRGREHN